MSRRSYLLFLEVGVVLMGAGFAYGQQAGFVLMGDSSREPANQPAEQRFVHPVTSPFFHEDSFVTTDLRVWYLYHDLPNASPIDGGKATAVALQLRLALTDRVQLVAYKDGYTIVDSGLIEDEGFNDIALGLKVKLVEDWVSQLHVAVGVGYEFAVGEDEVFQDDDEWRVWVSVNKGLDRLHLGAVVNVFFADDRSDGLGNSDHLIWNLHADYYVCEYFSPVLELNGYHVLDNGDEVVPFSGVDLANLGGSSGDPVVTVGLGFEVRAIDDVGIRTAYEWALTQEEDLFGYRWSTSVVLSF